MKSEPTHIDWKLKRCVPCEGGVDQISADTATFHLKALPNWELNDNGTTIRRRLNTGNFVKAVSLIQSIADLAEAEQHHPDLHLTGYRHLEVVLTTHAIGGLSENDFILAAKIDTVVQ
ncbi:4a-hydroxytetrahydrobiopterin dehydratase [Rhodopirellula halodulae]|uniref:4a-hydroxytetrahydrobiopterin dehydratase n=1 Tax=Rhodopirellula halodulae TaxID=2894198 RepID=UPI001E4381FA|nr:4a-hydroxytetrahydrobiopterin dehydratase [Rhodopirellula sp. JC737]MCC9658331.1 4a-hydroxytetrahydrobiopterin dehydratase [Rhodopirellula sp. JC737]